MVENVKVRLSEARERGKSGCYLKVKLESGYLTRIAEWSEEGEGDKRKQKVRAYRTMVLDMMA